LIHFKKV